MVSQDGSRRSPAGRRGFLRKLLAGIAAASALVVPSRLRAALRTRSAALTPTLTDPTTTGPYLGQIQAMAIDYAPSGWMKCDGTILTISGHVAMFSLLGTRYGGDGETTFALPDLRGRMPLQPNNLDETGEAGGESSHTLSLSETPSHVHGAFGSTSAGTSAAPSGALPAKSGDAVRDYAGTADTEMSSSSVATAGSGLAHNNMPPYAVVQFYIAVSVGTFPTS